MRVMTSRAGWSESGYSVHPRSRGEHEAGGVRRGARHIWIRHGPGPKRPAWERLAWSDWLYAQRIVDKVDPVQQQDGRWKLASPGWFTVGRRSVGFVLVAERIGDYLTPVTFFRVERKR